MTTFDYGLVVLLAAVAVVVAVAALIETHTWKLLVDDHARRITLLEQRGKQPDRAAMVD